MGYNPNRRLTGHWCLPTPSFDTWHQYVHGSPASWHWRHLCRERPACDATSLANGSLMPPWLSVAATAPTSSSSSSSTSGSPLSMKSPSSLSSSSTPAAGRPRLSKPSSSSSSSSESSPKMASRVAPRDLALTSAIPTSSYWPPSSSRNSRVIAARRPPKPPLPEFSRCFRRVSRRISSSRCLIFSDWTFSGSCVGKISLMRAALTTALRVRSENALCASEANDGGRSRISDSSAACATRHMGPSFGLAWRQRRSDLRRRSTTS
mmetsp:Transcript_4533/g.14455  ORF Transcript_4533/g.14455 Transcript_4533/m.14455 type:complete len:264 (-) Transcript_4533:421-1212(-)